MIHLCVIWRNNKWVITSSDTVTFEEKYGLAFKECREKMAESYWKDSEILKYLNEGIREIGKSRCKCSRIKIY